MKNYTESKWPNKAEPLPGATRRAPPANPPAQTQPAASESQERTQPPAEIENAPTHAASVPFMITHQMEADLRELGFSQERINTMTPGEAWEILQAEAGRIAGELAKLHRAGAIKNDQDASFYASLVRIFGATVSPAQEPAPPPITSEQLVPGPPRWLSREERAACYAADLEGAIGEEFIDHDPQPPARPARSSTRKKKRSPRKTAQ